MSESIYVNIDKKIGILDNDGNPVTLTAVESDSCNGCWFKREPGKPQEPFCKAVACGDYERPDGKSVIFQEIKEKGGAE